MWLTPLSATLEILSTRTQVGFRPTTVAQSLFDIGYPRAQSTSSEGIWTLQTHPKHLLRRCLEP